MPLLSEQCTAPPPPGRAHPADAGGGIPAPPHLRGLRRASLCCKADIYHPIRRPGADKEDRVACRQCGKRVKTHAVLNADDEQIWPVPAGFTMPTPRTAPAAPLPDAWPEPFPAPFPLHLPAGLQRCRYPVGDYRD